MLDIAKDQGPGPKCFFTHVHLSHTIDEKQPPTKKKPFSNFAETHFNHTIDVVLPKTAETRLAEKLEKIIGGIRYARVHLKLKDVIEGDFFDRYIKRGNIVLLSEGKPGVENVYSLHDGILRLELDKPTYERAGLAGKVMPTPGRKHTKARYAVELNLRLPSMVRGRPLFNRMVYAFTNALTETKAWLFFDIQNPTLDPESQSAATCAPKAETKPIADAAKPITTATPDAQSSDALAATSTDTKAITPIQTNTAPEQRPPPISQHHPIITPISPAITQLPNTEIPTFPHALQDKDRSEASDLLEWISLAMLDSPRLRSNDNCDPTLSRYQVPDLIGHLSTNQPEEASKAEIVEAGSGGDDTKGDSGGDVSRGGEVKVEDLSRMRWRGLIPSDVASKVLIATVKVAAKEGTWAAIRLQGFGEKKVTVLIGKGTAMVWEYD
ncbi:hypothetical protein CAC42_7788 [Sphaceloma murrayae]|uniref:Uncharacterized protein n=1 Tax=Sphaceloma murrayae TaxID=2082308 RepID=A0A2K1QXP9_9PEZI|nr:hypothetical protein CAC42_7788 [Sphaceloma murrayae]